MKSLWPCQKHHCFNFCFWFFSSRSPFPDCDPLSFDWMAVWTCQRLIQVALDLFVHFIQVLADFPLATNGFKVCVQTCFVLSFNPSLFLSPSITKVSEVFDMGSGRERVCFQQQYCTVSSVSVVLSFAEQMCPWIKYMPELKWDVLGFDCKAIN